MDFNAVDSEMVLFGQTMAYTLYSLSIILVVGWFGRKLTIAEGGVSKVSDRFFYFFVAFLTLLGLSLHLITANTIPWVELDLNRSQIQADKVFEITVADHKFSLPAEKLVIDCHDKVLFDVTSYDLTYGFGLFRQDNSLVLQMQVTPGHKNEILWEFNESGVYSIRSTEYSGPAGYNMIVKDAVEVIGCSN
ncbi:MAG: cytochrome C oxidase subunit II [Anaerolineae bacterium]|nr:cytochrome C oxidase subunit II [Anaerolineae bacterium]